jgi:hypothetical protein
MFQPPSQPIARIIPDNSVQILNLHSAFNPHVKNEEYITSYCYLFNNIRQETKEAGALNGLSQFALLFGRNCRDARGHDLTTL